MSEPIEKPVEKPGVEPVSDVKDTDPAKKDQPVLVSTTKLTKTQLKTLKKLIRMTRYMDTASTRVVWSMFMMRFVMKLC